MKLIQWHNDPRIGFWINNNPVRLYYGILTDELSEVSTSGIRGRWISLYLDPYSVMQGDVMMVVDIPTRWLMAHMDQRLGGNTPEQKRRLLTQELYEKWGKSDHEYYAGARILVESLVPARYIVGYLSKN